MRHELRETARYLRQHGLGTAAAKTAHYLYRWLVLCPWCRSRMRAAAAGMDLEDAFDFVFNSCGALLRPAQLRPEVEVFFRLVAATTPRVVVEIGTASGGMLFLFTRIAASDATLVSLDLRGAPFGGGYPRWRAPLYRAFPRPGQTLHLIQADSHRPETRGQVEERLGGRAIDLLFIDGDHSYAGVKADYELYAPLVARDGIIAFHDIADSAPDLGLEVRKLWIDLRRTRAFREIIHGSTQQGFGIGVTQRPEAALLPGLSPAETPTPR